ncbi:hypothetical protein [Algoriphagus sp.]
MKKPFLFLFLFLLFQNSFSQSIDSALLKNVLTQLEIEEVNCFIPLVSSLEIPNDEIIVVIPEIVESGEGYMALNSHILIVNNANGVIKSSFYKQKAWYSDALKINKLKVSYQPFKLNPNSETIGITLHYTGSSRLNPVEIEELSLYVRNGKKIQLILENYAIQSQHGETDGRSSGEFQEHKKRIEPSSVITNRFVDLVVKDSISNYQVINGERKNIVKRLETEVLNYEKGEYKKAHN